MSLILVKLALTFWRNMLLHLSVQNNEKKYRKRARKLHHFPYIGLIVLNVSAHVCKSRNI